MKWSPKINSVLSARSRDQRLEDWIDTLPLVFSSDNSITADISKAHAVGLIRKVGPRLYTTDTSAPPRLLLRSNALMVASSRHPGSVVSHRTALEMWPADNTIFLTGVRDQTDKLDGLTIKIKKGPGPQHGDNKFLDGLHVASPARAYLENLGYTRRTAGVSRVLSRAQVEHRLEELLRRKGEEELNRVRDQARQLAPLLGMQGAFEALDDIVGGLLRTRPEATLETAVAIARRDGEPFDAARLELFERLIDELLKNGANATRPRAPMLRDELQHLAFIESYFSNYIEGTKFELAEAREIVLEGQTPAARPEDAHDIIGTFELLVDTSEMSVSAVTLENIEDFEYLLCRRHAKIMGGRPDKRPGEFKREANRAGNTVFVAPELIRGTLERGLALLHRLSTPFQRAAFMMFMIAEVHPFDDGNGRIARAMMNAELAAHDENRIIIVTSFRPDYLGALRRLSREGDPRVLVRMLDRAHDFSARLDYRDFHELAATLEACNAFDESETRIMKLPPRA